MTDGVDGLILKDPNDVVGFAQRIRWLYEHPADRVSIARDAAVTAAEYTWDRNGAEIRAIFANALDRGGGESGSG
jgi:glycosyltransferase involved in cell wall biosynthesis